MQVQTPGNLELRPLPHLPAGGRGEQGVEKDLPKQVLSLDTFACENMNS